MSRGYINNIPHNSVSFHPILTRKPKCLPILEGASSPAQPRWQLLRGRLKSQLRPLHVVACEERLLFLAKNMLTMSYRYRSRAAFNGLKLGFLQEEAYMVIRMTLSIIIGTQGRANMLLPRIECMLRHSLNLYNLGPSPGVNRTFKVAPLRHGKD